MDNIQKTSFEKAAECFENGLIVEGAKYLFTSYYEQNKSKEILGYFDEIFFKPNIEELERIYNLNIEKLNLDREYNEFKNLPYYVIPIDENYFYLYDKEYNNIIKEDFTKSQIAIINLCTNENLESEEYLDEYYDEIKSRELIMKLKRQIETLKNFELNQ